MLNLNILIDLIINKYEKIKELNINDKDYNIKKNFIILNYTLLINAFKLDLYKRINIIYINELI
jgi:hypothetical protein